MSVFNSLSIFLYNHSEIWRRWRSLKYWTKRRIPFVDKSKKLDKQQLKKISEFWNNYEKVNPLFFNFYTQKTGEFHKEYLPENIYYNIIDKFYNNPDLAKWLDDKSLYERLLMDSKDIVKFPKTLCILSGGYWLTPSFELLKEEDVIKLIFEAKEVFIKKSVDSFGGKGVAYFNSERESVEKLRVLLGSMGKDGNLVVQKKIIQSQILASLNSSSVNTLRLISLLRSDGSVKVYSVVLRMGINGSFVDNASSGGITVGVKDDGRLKDIAYTAQGVKYMKYHPDSKVEFESIVIPNFDLIKDAVIRLHHQLPRLRLLSWDFALDESNCPIIIEVNMNMGELDFHQLNNGPLFGEDTREILDEVYGKKPR